VSDNKEASLGMVSEVSDNAEASLEMMSEVSDDTTATLVYKRSRQDGVSGSPFLIKPVGKY
jgi:hypothetical protein